VRSSAIFLVRVVTSTRCSRRPAPGSPRAGRRSGPWWAGPSPRGRSARWGGRSARPPLGVLALEGPGGGRQEDHLVGPVQPLVEAQRPVVHRRGQPEAVLDQHLLAGAVALVLAADLGDGDVGLVDDGQVVVGEVVEQGVGGLPREPGRRGGGSSSRSPSRTRPPASSPGRRRCASAGAGPPAAFPCAPARRAARPARPRCWRPPSASAPAR
jgi:hypothetical protein